MSKISLTIISFTSTEIIIVKGAASKNPKAPKNIANRTWDNNMNPGGKDILFLIIKGVITLFSVCLIIK